MLHKETLKETYDLESILQQYEEEAKNREEKSKEEKIREECCTAHLVNLNCKHIILFPDIWLNPVLNEDNVSGT